MSDDRTAKSKLREAAIAIVAEQGAAALTARGVAERAELSAGLIRHHYGSMAQLLAACDDYVAQSIRRLKEEGIHHPATFDTLEVLRQADEDHLMGYLSVRLNDASPEIDALVDTIVDDAAEYLAAGTASGVFEPTPNERQRAAILTIYTLGSLTLHRHVARLLGIDVRERELSTKPGFADYLRVQMEVLSGILTPTSRQLFNDAVAQLKEEP